MGYQALLFCPDEKIARTVTQVLSELEFAVESCVEPFAAVKKLMAEHFDAVVVDCDNDQNASLLFKSARNSATNQASLAVAVVEGQAGVAKAFRIGANLVLTKPINVEQAKGTLRVARGLLRKGEAAKPAGAPIPTTPVPPRATSAAPAAPARPATLSAANAAKRRAAAPPISATAASAPPTFQSQAAVSAPASSASAASAKAVTENTAIEPPATSAPLSDSYLAPEVKAASPINTGSATFGCGAASAPAPTREAEELVIEEVAPVESTPAIAAPDKISDANQKKDDAASPVAPSFTFGGANLPERSVGSGSTKIFLAIAAAVLLVVAGYFGWTQLHEKTSTPAFVPKPTSSATVTTAAPSRPSPIQPAASSAASSPGSLTTLGQTPAADALPPANNLASDDSASGTDDADVPAANSKRSSSAAPSTKQTAPSSKPAAQPDAPAPIILKNGSVKSSPKSAASDASAPSMVGLAAGGSDGSLSNLVAGDHAAKPILQTLTISQGVSQGLLLKKVQPVYPPNALRMRTEGAVKLLATVGKTGSITVVKVLSGEPLLGQAAMEAVKQWKYKPYLLNGEPVEIQTEVTINFKLPN
jgi:TonB family protein